MKENGCVRQPHAALDLSTRWLKARKIERLLPPVQGSKPLRLLEVGAGSGGISHYFATGTSGRYEVEAVDVADNRQSTEGYGFTLVTGTRLPFPDMSMDVVISNHVIEHVGNRAEQASHLAEIHRVLSVGGVAYLAAPNRWMLVEPHYRLIFLSWWPEAWRSSWLRLWRKGTYYDCNPLSRRQMEYQLRVAGFHYEQLHGEAVAALLDIENSNSFSMNLIRRIPLRAWGVLGSIFPTLIYRLKRA